MRLPARIPLVALLAVAAIAGASAPAASAAFGVSNFESLTCKENAPEGAPEECNAGTPAQLFTQAGGHPNFGITDFTFNEFGTAGNGVKTIRTDLPVGFSTNPQALPLCSMTGLRSQPRQSPKPSHCPTSSASRRTGNHGRPARSHVRDADGNGLQPRTCLRPPARVRHRHPAPIPWRHPPPLASWKAASAGTRKRKPPKRKSRRATTTSTSRSKSPESLSEGEAPIARSRLVFNGNAGIGLNTTATTCPGPQVTHLRVEPYVGAAVTASYTSTPTAAEENCKVLAFEPKFSLTPSSTRSDAPVGMTAELGFPLNKSSSEIENSHLRTSEVTLPAGHDHQPVSGPWPGSVHARTVRGRHRSHLGVVPVALGDRHRRVERAGTASRIAQGQDLPRRGSGRSHHRARRTRSTSPSNRPATDSSCASKAASSPTSPQDS